MKTVYSLGVVGTAAFIFLCSTNLVAQNNNSDASDVASVPVKPYSNISSYPTDDNEANRNCYQQIETQEPITTEDGAYIVQNNNAISTESSAKGTGDEMLMASGPLTYSGPLKLDDDGTGSSHGDPDHQNKTALQLNGQYLNADTDSYVVAPAWLLQQGVKVGDKADITYRVDADGLNWHIHQTYSQPSIVGDVGPMQDSVGEMSIKAAENLGYGIRDVNGIGPVPTLYGADCDPAVTIVFYPSGP